MKRYQRHKTRTSTSPELPLLLLRIILPILLLACIGALARPAAALAEPAIRLEVEGRPVPTDVPPILVDGRTLVPVRFVAEAMAAQVRWDGAAGTVTILYRNSTIVLTVGEAVALVDEKPVRLDVPAQIIRNRTFVPLRFVAESLGADVEWDAATRTARVWYRSAQVTGVTWTREVGAARLHVALSEPVGSYELVSRHDPEEVTLVLGPARAAVQSLPAPDRLLRGVRLSQEGDRVRVTAELARWARWRLEPDPDGRGFSILVSYQVLGVEARLDGTTPEVRVLTDGPVSYQVRELSGPDRLVLDIPSSTLAPAAPKEVPVHLDPVPWLQRVRLGQFQVNPDITRVVLDLTGHRPYEVVDGEDGLTIRFPPHLTGVTWETAGGRTRLVITGSGPLYPQVAADPGRQTLTVTLPDTRSGAARPEYTATGAAFTRLTLTEGPDRSLVAVVRLPYYLGHVVQSRPGEPRVVIDLVASPVYGRKIWIDAGHGGAEPGAVSKSGVLEKNLTLAISLHLMELLRAAGAEVLMTRTGDTTVGLYDRPRLANAAGAEVFVSVHLNSGPETAHGTETYHWTNHPGSMRLAQLLQKELVATLGLQDRGVKRREFVVLREASMPAALVEVAFLSNPREESLLRDPAFQAKAALAIRNGIFAYFQQEGTQP